MSTEALYDRWAATYDTVVNPTRDLEKQACEAMLADFAFRKVLELGGGTGKNTAWLATKATHVTSVDLSPEMQAIARANVSAENVEFRIGDVRGDWNFGKTFDLITSSLMLEHIEDLSHIFRQAAKSLVAGGHFYVCELHPFKQYSGSKARFETASGIEVLECFEHHVTDYTNAATDAGFMIDRVEEWFDDGDRNGLPRLIAFLFRNR